MKKIKNKIIKNIKKKYIKVGMLMGDLMESIEKKFEIEKTKQIIAASSANAKKISDEEKKNKLLPA
jgi:hypothetical protein